MEELPMIMCVGCGKILANKWNEYNKKLSQGISPKDALTQLGLTRYCCRYRMMNPFKIPIKAERQIDPRNIGIEKQMEDLTITTETQVQNKAPLQIMKRPTNAYTIVPYEGITLPEVPTIILPDIPGTGGEIEEEKPVVIVRRYQAW